MTTDSTAVQRDFIIDEGPTARVFSRAQLEFLNPHRSIVVFTVHESESGRSAKLQIGIVGYSHTVDSIAAAAADPMHKHPPILDFHGARGIFVDASGAPMFPDRSPFEIEGVYDTGLATGWFDIRTGFDINEQA